MKRQAPVPWDYCGNKSVNISSEAYNHKANPQSRSKIAAK